ncbi:MAG: hypothetical protein GWN29_11260, partial [Gammaproteobacteria bacterium]|nr:hypothetical protein [Gammaproteobacteria bacterium]
SPEVAYSPSDAGVRGATVRVEELPDGGVFDYFEHTQAGVYVNDDTTRIKANTAYALTMVTSEGEIVRARTTTPDEFSVDQWLLLDE